MKPDKPPVLQRFKPRHKAMWATYAAVGVLLAVVGWQLSSTLFADPVTPAAVNIVMNKPEYNVGDVPRFTIINNSSDTVQVVNNCPGEPLRVWRWGQGQWQQVHDQAASSAKCQYEPRVYTIMPHAQVGASYIYWPRLFAAPGRYRIEVPITGGAANEVPSVEFDVVSSTSQK